MEPCLPRRFMGGERVSSRVVLTLDAFSGAVAVKLAASADAAASREAAREYATLASLAHPAFPTAVSFGFLADGRAWLAMERAAGEMPAGPCDAATLARIGDGLCEALSYLHARALVHRDVKLEHVRFDAETSRVMLLDVGLAAAPAHPGNSGSPGTMAPEMAAGMPSGERADVYSLGAVLYELAAGRPPFRGDIAKVLQAQRGGTFAPLPTFRPDLPAAFGSLVERMLDPDPVGRPASAEECRKLIASALGVAPGPRAGEVAFRGRDHEVDALAEIAELAKTEARTCFVVGVPGSGRTRLLSTVAHRLALAGMPVITRSAAKASPLAGLAEDLGVLLPGMPALSEDGAAGVGDALRSACQTLAGSETHRLPLVILVDDADRAADGVRDDIETLRAALPPGVLLVVSDGPQAAMDSQVTANTTRLDLGPLSETAVRALVASHERRAQAGIESVTRALMTTRQPADILDAVRAPGGPLRGLARGATEDPETLLRAGRISAVVAAWRERLRGAASMDDAERSRALSSLGHALWAQADQADALAHAEQALSVAVTAGDPVAEAEAATILGRIYGAFGSTRDAVGWQRRALQIATTAPGVRRHVALVEMGLLMIREGHLDAATRALSDAAQEAELHDDAATAALARARMARARALAGDVGAADRLVRRALTQVADAGCVLAAIEVGRHAGVLACGMGHAEDGLARLQDTLVGASAAGFQQEMPAIHEALARASLRLAVRLRTPTGAIVDRRQLEVARAHVEKGLDLSVTTGRMADRAALTVISARCALLGSEARLAHTLADEAHGMALQAGDLLVASQARLIRAEALLDLREFGVALAEARIACEAFERSGDLEDAWRARALVARVHGAWGMTAKQEVETEAATRILRGIEASLRDAGARRAYMADVDRAAAIMPPVSGDASRARRGQASELQGDRFAGRADTEDLVEALIGARQHIERLERRVGVVRSALTDAAARRDALLRATALAEGAGPARTRDITRVLALVSRASADARVVLVSARSGRLRVRAIAGRAGHEVAQHEQVLAMARQVITAGQGSIALGSTGGRRSDAAPGDVHVALPLASEGGVCGALIVRPTDRRGLRRADVRLLQALAPLFARALARSGERTGSAVR